MVKLPEPSNDNRAALARHVPIVGQVGDAGVVVITDPTWRPSPERPAPALFPNEARDP